MVSSFFLQIGKYFKTCFIMEYLEIVSFILFLISSGSMHIHIEKNADGMIANTDYGKIIFGVFYLITIAFLSIITSDILSQKWYFNILIAFFTDLLLARIIAEIYTPIFGYKSKPSPNLIFGKHVRHNINILDSLITFGLGFILFFISRILIK
jgi:hypothetical protein